MNLLFEVFIIVWTSYSINSQYFVPEVFTSPEDESIQISALGRVAQIGELYDARTDKFLTINMFNVSRLNSAYITTTQASHTSLTFTSSYSYEERFNKLDVSAELKLSVLGGLCEVSGSGHFLKDSKSSAKVEKASMIQKLTTVMEYISISDGSLKPFVNFEVVNPSGATHMVVGIEWGGNIYISVESDQMTNEDGQVVEGSLGAKIQLGLASISGQANVHISESDRKLMNNFKIEIFGDVLPDQLPETFLDALQFMKTAPGLLKSGNSGKGKAMNYVLLPINTITKIWKLTIMINSLLTKIDEVVINDCVEMFDKISLTLQKVNDIVNKITPFEKFIPDLRIEKVDQVKRDFKIFQANMSGLFAETLVKVRSGKDNISSLKSIIKTTLNYCSEVERIKLPGLVGILKEVTFIDKLKNLNITFIDKTNSLDILLMKYDNVDIYVLFYNSDLSQQDSIVYKGFISMSENKTFYGKNTLFFAINNEFYQGETNKLKVTKISQFNNQQLIKDNFDFNIKELVWKPIHKYEDFIFTEMITGFKYIISKEDNGHHFTSGEFFLARAVSKDNMKLPAYGVAYYGEYGITFFYQNQFYSVKSNENYPKSFKFGEKIVEITHCEVLTNPNNVTFNWIKKQDKFIPSKALKWSSQNEQDIYYGRRIEDKQKIDPALIINAKNVFTYHSKNATDFEYLVY